MDKRADWLRLTQKKEAINFRLGRDQLTGPDEMILKKTQINRIQKAMSKGVGIDLIQIGSLFSALIPLPISMGPTKAKTLG